MREKELRNFLLEKFPKENEQCEWKSWSSFKNAIAGRKGDDAISYISAISNMQGGHLIVGVEDKTLKILGIKDFADYTIENIKFRILSNCSNLNSDKFAIENFTTSDTKKTVWVFKIPKHSLRLPVYAHKKAWQRIGDSLIEMTKDRLEAILGEISATDDWSSKIITNASIEDLDPLAITKAREQFSIRNPKYAADINAWNDIKFLDKAKLTIKGNITRTALILLGKEESAHFLGSFVKIRWELKNLQNQIKAGEIFSIPFILKVDELYNKIRNLKYVYLSEGTLFPDEFLRYEPFSIRESINNAIAHQDYSKCAMINVVEFEDDHLIFSNYGSFLPKSVEDIVLQDTPEEIYRNPFLVEAMKNLNMIETHGGGIKKIFDYQRKRFFPMPDFDLSDGKVKATITGKVLDDKFIKILSNNPTLSMSDILLLDKVQKNKKDAIDKEEFYYLKRKKLIEGRKTNFYLSHIAIEPTKDDDLKAEYIRNRGVDDDFLKKLILQYLEKWKKLKRNKIEKFLWDKLSVTLEDKAKKVKVYHLLQALKREKHIRLSGFKEWELNL